MAYTPHEWSTGETITAAKLNALENGVAAGGGGSPLVTLTFPDTVGSFSKYFEFCIVDEDGDACLFYENGEVYYRHTVALYGAYNSGDSVLAPLPLPVPSDGNRLMFISSS